MSDDSNVVEFPTPDRRGEKPIAATPFAWREPKHLPRRRFIYGKHYSRRFISETVAAPGVGKSSLIIVEALAIVTGRELLGIKPAERTNVWIWNGEDPHVELERRVIAAMVHYGISPSEVEGRLFLDSGRDMKIILATEKRGETIINAEAADRIMKTVTDNRIGLLVIDPFRAAHRAKENDSGPMESVMEPLCAIVEETNSAIELVHHTRKTNGAKVEVEDGRGSGATLPKVRSARTLNPMSEADARQAGVKSRREYFYANSGKSSLAPPSDHSDWHHLVNVDLDNGDSVGVATACRRPSALSSVVAGDLAKAQAALSEGRWRANVQAKDWGGIPIAKSLGIGLDKDGRARVSGLIKAWSKTGHLVSVEGKDENRKPRTYLEVGKVEADSAPPAPLE